MSEAEISPTLKRSSSLGRRTLVGFQTIASIGIFALMFHTLAHVVGRYAFNSPLSGTIELVSYWYMPIIAFLGFALAKHAKEFIEAPLIFDNLTWGNRRILVIVNGAIAAIMCGLLAYYGLVGKALHGFEIKAVGGVSTIQVWPVYFLPSIIFFILLGMFLHEIIKAYRGDIGDNGDGDERPSLGQAPDLIEPGGEVKLPSRT